MNNSMKITFTLLIRIVFNKSRWDRAGSSKSRIWNLCSCMGNWIPHNWGLLCPPREGWQVFKSSFSSSSSFCPRYDSEGNYVDSLPDLATPRRDHGCTTFVSATGEKVKISTIIFVLYFKQALLVAGGQSASSRLSSTELFFPSQNAWTAGRNLPRYKPLPAI